MAICTQNSLIYRFMHWLMCLLMISVQPGRKFLWNAPVFPEIWRAGCNMVWDGSSRTVGRLPTCYDVWSSQGLINAVVPFSCVPAGEHFCLGILVPLSLCLVFLSVFLKLILWSWDRRLQLISWWCPGGPACLEKASKAGTWAGLLRTDKLPLGETHCPSTGMGKRLCSIHCSRATTHTMQPPLRQLLEFHGTVDLGVSSHGPPRCQPARWAREGDPTAWAVDSLGLLSMARQHSFKH